MEPLTPKQTRVLTFIRENIEQTGHAPTFREIQDQFGYRSPNSITLFLDSLQRKGLLVRQPNVSRSMTLPGLNPPMPPLSVSQTVQPLTQRQAEILDFLISYHQQNGRIPSYREIMKFMKTSSVNGVIGFIDALKRKGYIRRGPTGSQRSLQILAQPASTSRETDSPR